ncbi:MAG: putative metalloprotease CJM1_0395 family protein [Zoogloea sp.]|uniref:putative metalloprotease CJM1_0395 family protein n=1 Tax=Zoogloea sp. TaxID=49181 RepID=UPI00261EF7C4|nr:putative metalloprotease CJM1_0395 family protein [Zoogloea sp.]MDD3328198.1 putative metalloprotease CJM1_0395 family protein [Zoogloea sp.]
MSVSALGSAQVFAYSPLSARPTASAGVAEAGATSARGAAASGAGLSEADLKIVSELKARDRVVRTHEMAHLAAGAGIVTRGASFTYQTGPDGQRYAVGGEVGISTSPGRTPEETLAKADQIRAAALAPADPSSQDLRVAAEAAQMAAEARQELAAASGNQEAGRVGAAYAGAAAAGAPAGGQVDAWA